MQNFEHATAATETALNSAGSAAHENERYMESLEAREQAVKAEFEDFANRVLSKDLVSGFLSAGEAALKFVDTDLGAAITRIAGIGTAVSSVVGIVGTMGAKLALVSKQLSASGGATGLLGLLTTPKTVLIIGAVAAGIAALVEGITAIHDAYNEAHPDFDTANKNLQETQTEIENTTNELEEYKKKLQELDEIDPKDRASSWSAERAELEVNVQTAEAYLEVLKQIEQAQTGKIEDSKYITGYTGQNVGDFSDGYIGTEASGQLKITKDQLEAINGEYQTQEEAVMSIALALKDYITGWETFDGMSMDDVVAELNNQLAGLGINVHSTVETVSQFFDNIGALADKAADGFNNLTKAEQEQATQYLSDYQAYVQGIANSGNILDAAQKKQLQNYTALQMAASGFNTTQASSADIISYVASEYNLSADAAARLAAALGYIDSANINVANGMVQLADGAWALKENCYQAADGLYYLKDGCNALAGSGDEVAGTMSQISSAMAEVQGSTDKFVGALFDMNGELTTTGQAALIGNQGLWQLANAEAAANQEAAQANFDNLVNEILTAGQAASWSAQQIAQMFAYAGLSTSEISSTYGDITTDKRAQLAYGARNFQQGENLQSYLTRVAKENLEKAIRESDALQSFGSAYGWSDSKSTSGGSSGKSAEEKAAEEAEKQAKKAQQAQEKAAKESQSAYESAASSAEQAAQQAAQAAEQAAEEAKQKILDTISELKDASDKFWSSKTDAVEETNTELDRQKQLEEKLKALEEAKQKKILLYKNGQFQYDKDYGSIAKAQADYEETRDKIHREKELEQLKEMKENATEIFNEMKDIINNGGNVTQDMINKWLNNMSALGVDYYDSNKELLGQWLDWARGAITEFSQSALDAIGSYTSTSSYLSNGTYGSGGGAATDTNGSRYANDPLYWDENGEFVGFDVAFWIDRFDKQLKSGFEPENWLGGGVGTSVFDDWADVLKSWAEFQGDELQGMIPDMQGVQDMLKRAKAAKIVLAKYKDLFESLDYTEYAEIAEKIQNLDLNKAYNSALAAGAKAHPDDPFGMRIISPADYDTVAGKLYNLLEDISWYEGLTKSRTAESESSKGKKYEGLTIAGDLKSTAGLSNWHKATTKKFTDAMGDYFPLVQDVAFDPEKLRKFYEDNEAAIIELSEEAWFNAKTQAERDTIHLEAEARRQARDYAGELLGIDTTGISEAERERNRQATGRKEERDRQKKTDKMLDSMRDVLEEGNKNQKISDEYVNEAKDYIAKTIKENREAIEKAYTDTEKEKLKAQNEQLEAIKNEMTRMQDEGMAIKTTDRLDWETTDFTGEAEKGKDWLRDVDPDELESERLKEIQAEMLKNSKAWWNAKTKEEQDALHKANEKLAQEAGGLTYSGSTGVWSKNANGTHNFRGGLSLVGENGPEMRILGKGDNIIPHSQTENLWKWSSTTPQAMLSKLGARQGGGDTNYAFDVSRIELPNVTDAKSFVNGLKNYALQYSYKR